MIVVGLDPDRRPGDVLDRVFPPEQSDETFADDYFRCLRPVPTPAGCSNPNRNETQP